VENPAVITNGDTSLVGVNTNWTVGGNETVSNNSTIGGTLNVTGVITGNGSNLSNIPALALVGAIPYANLSGLAGSASGTILSNTGSAIVWAAPGITAISTNTWKGTNTFTNAVIATNDQAGNQFAGTFTGNGHGLTNMPVLVAGSGAVNLTPTSGILYYATAGGATTAPAFGTNYAAIAPCAGVIYGLVFSGTVPPSGDNITNVVYTNGVASSLVASFGNGTTSFAMDSTHTVSVVQGERINFTIESSWSPGAVQYYSMSLYFAPSATIP